MSPTVNIDQPTSIVVPSKPAKLTRGQRAEQRGRCGACLKKLWDCRCKARKVAKATAQPVEVVEVGDAEAR